MKKVVFFSHGLSANGIETFLVNVFGSINKEKYDISVIIAIDEGVEVIHEKKVLDMGIKVFRAGDLDSVSKKIAYIKNVKRILSQGNYDIAHSNMDLLNGITLYLAKKAGIKKRICHAHTSKSQYKPIGMLSILKQTVHKVYYSLMVRLIMNSSTQLLACSEVAGKYFYGNKSFDIIENGIDIDSYDNQYRDESDKPGYIKSLGLSNKDTYRIISVGRISEVKNPLFALEIIKELSLLRSDFKYIWVGSGELEDEVKNKSKELGIDNIVIFTGVRTDVPKILSCCDCFLMTSLFEGLPFSLVEAQAAGLRCIVSDVVTKEADLGLISFYSLDKSAKEWAYFINSEIDSPMPKLDKEKSIKFDIKNTVKQLEEIYDRE